MKKTILIISCLTLFLSSSINCLAQISKEKKELKPMIDWDELYHEKYIGIGLMGLLKHPGLELNYSYPSKFYIKEKTKKGNVYRISKARRWDIFARYYYHRNFHHNVIITVGRTWQRALKYDRFFISQADAGIARTFYPNPTFRVVNDEVKRTYFDGDFYASFNYRFGIGRHYHRKNEILRVYSYFGIMNFAPYNNLYYSRLVVGININKFLKK